MNVRYHIGRMISVAQNRVLSRAWLPLTNLVPYGRNWAYDVARFAGTRDLHTIVDVGANVGQTALHLRRFFPRATIHCFEPVAETASLLQQAVRAYPHIHVHTAALSAQSGTVAMTLDADSERSAVAVQASPGTRTVAADTLDRFATRAPLETIDILKIDVEGHELAVLAGATQLLSARRIRSVYIEVGMEASDPGHTYFPKVQAELEGHGFSFAGLYEPWRYRDARHRLAFANALYWHSGVPPHS